MEADAPLCKTYRVFYPQRKATCAIEPGGFLLLQKEMKSGMFWLMMKDVIRLIFQRLISPQERHKHGQYFTPADVVDLIVVAKTD